MPLPAKAHIDEIADLLGCTSKRLRQLADEDYFPPAKNGMCDFGLTVRGYNRHSADSKTTKAQEKLTLSKLEAQDRQNRIAAKLEGEQYMETQAVSELIEIGIKSIDAVPAKMQSEFAMTETQTQRLQQLLDEARRDWVKVIDKK